MLVKEAFLDQIPTVVYTFCPVLAAGNTSAAALPYYLAYLNSIPDPGHRSERRAVCLQGPYYAARQNPWWLTPHL